MAAAAAADLIARKKKKKKTVGVRDRLDSDEDLHDEDDRLATVEKRLRPRFEQVLNSEVFTKIDADKFKLVTLEEWKMLVNILSDGSSSAKVKLKYVRLVLLTLLRDSFTDEELDFLFRRFYEDESKAKEKVTVTADELFDVFAAGDDIKELLKRRLEKRRGEGDDLVTREDLKKRIAVAFDRNDALVSLPVTTIYVSLFIILVMGHLDIYNRQLLERSLEEWTNGRDPRERATENVDDIASWWEWIQLTGTEGPLGKVKNHTLTGFPYCLMASRNILVGDVMVKHRTFDGTETSTWLLHTATAQYFLAGNRASATRFRDAARAAALSLMTTGGTDPNIEFFYFRFITYNEYARMFADTSVTVPLKASGFATAIIHTSAVSIDPYPWYLIPADVLFLVVISFIFVNEAKDAFAALRLCECHDYFTFWNVVDWVSITLSFSFSMLGLFVVQAMSADSLTNLIDDEYNLKVDVMKLTASQLDSIDDDVSHLQNLYLVLQYIMAANSCCTVLKFFKAFNANPNLRLITDTLLLGLQDFVHYFIIFSTIFLPFVIVGHIMFGGDLQEFGSIAASINTGFLVLMGEFEWYVEVAPESFVSRLPSGMPKIFLFAWYVTYVSLVFLVLLNMLLAIIFSGYDKATENLRDEIDAPPIWRQLHQYFVVFRRETRGFVSLQELHFEFLKDGDDGEATDEHYVHPGREVTTKSLQEAFKMTETNAQWLYDWVKAYVHTREIRRDENEHFKKKLQKIQDELTQRSNKENLALLLKAVQRSASRMDFVRAKKTGADSEERKSSSIYLIIKNLTSAAEELMDMTKGVRDDQKKLAKRMEEMVATVTTRAFSTLKHQPEDDFPPSPPDIAVSKKVKKSMRTNTGVGKQSSGGSGSKKPRS